MTDSDLQKQVIEVLADGDLDLHAAAYEVITVFDAYLLRHGVNLDSVADPAPPLREQVKAALTDAAWRRIPQQGGDDTHEIYVPDAADAVLAVVRERIEALRRPYAGISTRYTYNGAIDDVRALFEADA